MLTRTCQTWPMEQAPWLFSCPRIQTSCLPFKMSWPRCWLCNTFQIWSMAIQKLLTLRLTRFVWRPLAVLNLLVWRYLKDYSSPIFRYKLMQIPTLCKKCLRKIHKAIRLQSRIFRLKVKTQIICLWLASVNCLIWVKYGHSPQLVCQRNLLENRHSDCLTTK